MKKAERIIAIILLFIIGISNVSPPAAYAAQTIAAKIPPPTKPSTTPVAPPKFRQPNSGSVLGASTSLFSIGAGSTDTQQSASKRVPIRVEQLTRKVYQTDEAVTVSVINPNDDPFSTTVVDTSGKSVDAPITESNNGMTTTVQIAGSNEIKPGKYTVKITDGQGDVTKQDFSWGVLAFNTDKTMYHPGEQADISMAVLNDKGDMVCDASLQLQITNQAAGINDLLTTSSASSSATDTNTASSSAQIIVNPQCQQHDFSLQPDYETHYTFAKAGTYNLQLTAQTQNGTHTISSTIPVTDQIPFDVQRISATRIYPLDTYPMTFNITAHQDFNGTVTETVPQDFTITPATESAQATSYDDMQTVYLNANDPAAKLQQAITASGSGGLVMPFHGDYPITQGFGAQMTDPTLQAFYTQYGLAGHDGIDFGVPMDTQLYSVDNGTVMWSGPGDYGTTIIIQHSWGQSYYGHLSTTAVKVGDQVTKGELIGYSGESGEATGPHLHFGMRPNNPDMKNGYYGKVDPLSYLPYGHPEADTSVLEQPTGTITPSPLFKPATVLSASTSASDASDSAQITSTPSPVPSAIAIPTAIPQVSVTPTPTSMPLPTSTETAPTPSAQPTTPTPAPNSNFSVLDKEIQENEAIANAANTEEVKVITWHVNLKKGESTTLGYDYQAPHVSPQFYLLGPMQFYQHGSNKVIFQEQRQWEIASDDVGVEWYSNTTGNKWNGYSWRYRKKIAINHTKVAGSGGSGTVSFDNFGDTPSGAAGASVSWSQTVGGSCTDSLLVIMISTYNNDTYTVTDNGSSSGVIHLTTTTNATSDNSAIYYKINPPSSNSLQVSMSPNDDIMAGSMSFCNVNQTTPFGTAATGTTGTGGTATSGSMSVTAGQMIVDSFSFFGNGGPWNPGGGQTAAWSTDPIIGGAASYEAITSSGTKTMSWTPGFSGDTWAEAAAPINPDTVGGGGSLATFPALVSISDTTLGNHAQGGGNDILFTDSNGETLLPFEIESYSSGNLLAWVELPSLSSTSDTIIYLYYGNPSVTSSLANPTGVWDTNYQGVWHLGNGTTLSLTDSTTHNDATTNSGSVAATTGEINGGALFSAATNQFLTTSSANVKISGDKTIQAWVKSTNWAEDGNGVDRRIVYDDVNGTNFYQLTLCQGVSSTGCGSSSQNGFVFAVDNSTQFVASGFSSSYVTGTWYLLTGTYISSSHTTVLYVNGSAVSNGSVSGWSVATTNTNVIFGGRTDGEGLLVGSMDEVEISGAARTANWVTTQYNDQSSPGVGGFLTSVGGEETSIYAPTLSQVMRHGEWFSAEGAVQPFTF